MSVIDFDTLPHPGTPPFFPAVLSRIRAAAPSLPLDPVVLQSLLLCLLADDKNLILRTREEDIGSVSKLASSSLTSIFGYSTHKLKIHQDSKQQTPAEFLHSLFLRSSTATATPTPNSPSASDEFTSANISIASHKAKAIQHNKRRPGSRNSTVAKRSKVQRQLVQRSFSYPAEGPVVPSIATISTSPPNTNLFADQNLNHPPAESSKPDIHRPVLRPPGIQTDPSPFLTRSFSTDTATLPRALVISGLENTSVPSQRALSTVLSEKRVVLDDTEGNWMCNLPQGFIIVYVCAADSKERPAIHKTLLDRFAMSTTITLHPSTQHAIRHALPHQRFPFSQTTTPTTMTTPTPIFPETLLDSLRSLASPPDQFAGAQLQAPAPKTKIHPNLFLYISDLFSAARHHPQLDGMLLTVTARKDVDGIVRAARVIGGDLTGAEFIRAMGKGAEARQEEENMFEEGAEDDDDDDDDRGRLDSGSHWQSNGNGFVHDSNSAPAAIPYPSPNESLDVSEADIARIVPRVLSHRLRVRNGPEDEIVQGGLQHGAVDSCAAWAPGDDGSKEGNGDEIQRKWERSTVKDILVKILSEV